MDLIDVLAAHAARRGPAPAIHFLQDGVDVCETVSFGALHAQAQALAAVLQSRHAPGERVLLALPSGLDYVRAFFACVYAGLIAVPLFPPASRKPRHLQRLRGVMADAAPSLVLCPEDCQEVLREIAEGKVRTLAELAATASEDDWVRPDGVADGEAIAFLQYTSGSTGTPKGVVVRHRNLLANLALMRRAYGFDEHGRMVNWLPLYHDMGLIGGVLAPLFAGMPCYLMSPQTFMQTPSAWLQALSRHRGTASFAPSFAYALCLRSVSDTLLAQLDLSAWEHAINGAEPIHAATLRAFGERFAAAGFRAHAASPGYGQAEATLCVSATPREALPRILRLDKTALEAGRAQPAKGDAEAVEFVACGHPQPGHDVAIVSPDGFRRREPGGVGEIWLAGPSNTEGYWNQPEASQATFEACIAGEAGRYLRSGDLGFLHEGQLVVCGRLKDLIILNGRNLYPHDIEFAITEAEPGIRSGRIAAFSIADAALGREKLVVVAEPQRRFVDPERHAALFTGLRQAVYETADCAIDLIVLIEAGTIPMTTSGKISRQGAKRELLDGSLRVIATSADAADVMLLPEVDAAQLRAAAMQGEDTAQPCRAYLVRLIAELQPGLRADFDTSPVMQGLDSMALALLGSRLQTELGWSVPVHEFFGERPLSHWADGLHRHLTTGSKPSEQPLHTAAGVELRQSFAQRRLWYLHQLDPSSAQHNIVMHLCLQGPLGAGLLKARIDKLVERHASLRTVFRDSPAGPMQQIQTAIEPALQLHDLHDLDIAGQHDAVQSCIDLERATPFDLCRGPLLRAQWLRRPGDEHDVLLCMHHAAVDGRSAQRLLADLAGQAGLPAPSYADFAAWESTHWTSEALDAELAFWRNHLAGMPTVLHIAGPGDGHGAGALSFELPNTLCERLAALARQRGMTLFMVLLAAYELVLHHVSEKTRFIVGTDVAARPPGFQEVVGFFVNQLPLRCDLDGQPTLGNLLERVRMEAQAAYAHQALPFDLLVSGLAPPRVPGRAPLIQAKLNYQPAPRHDLSLGTASITHIEVFQAMGEFDLVLDVVHGPAGMAGLFKHKQSLLASERAACLLHLWQQCLEHIEPLLEQPLPSLRVQMHRWEHAWQQQRQQVHAQAARARLGLARRRALTV